MWSADDIGFAITSFNSKTTDGISGRKIFAFIKPFYEIFIGIPGVYFMLLNIHLDFRFNQVILTPELHR